MSKEIIVNARPYETRLAVMENGKLAEFFVERDHRSIVGNIYRGKVTRVLPGMQSAFVDIALGKDAFLYVEDVIANLEKMLEIFKDSDDGKTDSRKKPAKRKTHKNTAIKDLLKKGEYILVQVAKEQLGTKGARITSHVTLPGKYLVLMPTINRIGISRKITSPEKRDKLREMLMAVRKPKMGYIIRTAAEKCTKKVFNQEVRYLHNQWNDITKTADKKKDVGLIYTELDLLRRVLRDIFGNDFSRVIIDDQDVYTAALDFINRNQKTLAKRIKFHTGSISVFEEYGIEKAIEEALQHKVMLKSGGSIVIHQTEALVSVDVNTGRFVGSKNLEDTALKTNLEAAAAIVHQLRLREMGGIIVIDFIDMDKKKNRKTLFDSLTQQLLKDKAERTVLGFNDFGLIILTRKRVRRSLERVMTQPCHYCAGMGTVKTLETIACDLLRELEKVCTEGVRGELRVALNPDVSGYLEEKMEKHLQWIRDHYSLEISLLSKDTFHQEQFDIIEL